MLSSLCGHCLPSCQAERQAPWLLVEPIFKNEKPREESILAVNRRRKRSDCLRKQEFNPDELSYSNGSKDLRTKYSCHKLSTL